MSVHVILSPWTGQFCRCRGSGLEAITVVYRIVGLGWDPCAVTICPISPWAVATTGRCLWWTGVAGGGAASWFRRWQTPAACCERSRPSRVWHVRF